MLREARLGLVVMCILVYSAAFADDLAGRDRFLCSAGTVTAFTEDGYRIKAAPFDFNIPQFVEMDLQARRLSTLQASGQDRSTDIKYVERTGGHIVLQGVEEGRTFSWLIDESMGLVTVAIAVDGFNIAVFGACTPLPVTK